MRAKYYLSDAALKDFYKFNYRKLVQTREPAKNFDHQYKVTVKRKDMKYRKIYDYGKKIIFDIGGACGGVLKNI